MSGVWLVVSYYCNAGDKDWSANFAQETHGACCSIKAANSAAIELACSMLKEKGFADPDLERKLNFAQQDRSSDDMLTRRTLTLSIGGKTLTITMKGHLMSRLDGWTLKTLTCKNRQQAVSSVGIV